MKYVTLVVFGLLLLNPAARAEEGSRQEVLGRLGKAIKRVLEGNDASEVRFGPLVGDRQPEANAATGLLHDLQRVLASQKVSVTPSASFELRGRYELVKHRKFDRHVIELVLEVQSEKKGVVAKLKGYFTHLEDVLETAGLTVAIPPNADATQVNDLVAHATDDEARPPLDGTRVRAAAGSEYSLELLVRDRKDAFRPLAPAARKGMAFVKLAPDDVYAIRVNNDSANEVAVTLSIDGLNVFSFGRLTPPDGGGYPRLLIPAKTSRLIKGWPVDLRTSREFLVASYPETVAYALGKPRTDLGIISATFVRVWEKGKKPKDARSASGPLGTGLGETIRTPLQMVEREFGDNPSSVQLRYTADGK